MRGKDPEWLRYHISLKDGGPYYTETNLNRFIVEPWNAFSSLFFLIPAIYWAFKIRKTVRKNWFIAYCVPLLFVGGLGSTFFHAFRASHLLLYMDVLPILVLTLSVSAYFWHKVFNKWYLTLLTLVLSFLLRSAAFEFDFIPVHTAINISYALVGTTIFLPILIVLTRTQFKKVKTVIASAVLFFLALVFREIDARSIHTLSMGTHFLWHILSAVGAFLLADYLYFIADYNKTKAGDPKTAASGGGRKSKSSTGMILRELSQHQKKEARA